MRVADKQETALIVGAGPAGLTAAYELLETTAIHPIVCEQSGEIGGISQTVRYKGNRMDIGGHRFFSKSKRVTDFWNKIMPLQGALALDDILIGRKKELAEQGSNPEEEDRVMLVRERISRIYYEKLLRLPHIYEMENFCQYGTMENV